MVKSWQIAMCAVSLVVPAALVAQNYPLQPTTGAGGSVQALVAQIAQLKLDEAAQKAQFEQELTAARFRITALEANQKQGGTTAQLEAQIQTQIGTTRSLGSRLDALTARFDGHTHTYDRTSFGWNSAGGSFNITQPHIAQPAKTSGPN